MWSERQALEIFHRSIRYSEDMDLDIHTMAPRALRSNVETLLAATSFRQSLRAHELEVAEFSAPKQTQTTQRWKVRLRLLEVAPANANMILRRLAQQNLVTHLTRGRWLVGTSLPRFALPELLSAPCPAYVSMQSALFHHGLIEQVPAVVYAATLGKPRRVSTPIGTISFHRLPPELFRGFEV